MIKQFVQSIVEAEVARQLAEQEQRQVAAARLERRPGSWPLATTPGELAGMISDGRLVDVGPIARKLTRRQSDNSPSGWSEVPVGFEGEIYLTAALGQAIACRADPPTALRELLATIAGLLERYGAPSARVQPARGNARWPWVAARVGSVDVVGQVCPRPDGSTFVLIHARDEVCPVWVDGEERFA